MGTGSTGDIRTRGRIMAAAVLSAGSALAAGLLAQHRIVRRAEDAARQGLEAEGLVMPHDVVDHEVRTDDGAHIHVTEAGSGPAMVLLHGLALSGDIWVHQFTDLARAHRIIAVDLRGHGSSTAGADGFGAPDSSTPAVSRMAADVRQVLEILDLRDILLVGHSMGGMVALRAVADMGPDATAARLRGLALVSTTAGPLSVHPLGGPAGRLLSPLSASLTSVVDRAGASRVPNGDARWWISRAGFGPEAVPAQVQLVQQLHGSIPPGVLTQLVPSLTALDMWGELADIEVPTLVVAGTRDRLLGLRHARRLSSSLPHAQMVELPRCGHMPMLERRNEFSHLLEEFAAKVA